MTKEKETLKQILSDARKCPTKGRLYIYERYKLQLENLNLSSEEYMEACRKLARYLEV